MEDLPKTKCLRSETALRQASGEPHIARKKGEHSAMNLLGELRGRFYVPRGVEEQDLTTLPALLDPNVGEDAFMNVEAAKHAKARLLMAVRSTQVLVCVIERHENVTIATVTAGRLSAQSTEPIG